MRLAIMLLFFSTAFVSVGLGLSCFILLLIIAGIYTGQL